MDFTILLIGLGIIIAIIIVGKILKIVAKIIFTIILILAIALGIFWWQKDNIFKSFNKTGYSTEFNQFSLYLCYRRSDCL